MYNWNKTLRNSEFIGISFLHFTFSRKKKKSEKYHKLFKSIIFFWYQCRFSSSFLLLISWTTDMSCFDSTAFWKVLDYQLTIKYESRKHSIEYFKSFFSSFLLFFLYSHLLFLSPFFLIKRLTLNSESTSTLDL